ncbi:MAG TPA: FHA domain-containing protein [Kofleriaceae bacterium]
MPKASAVHAAQVMHDPAEDEKTTIESGWEDENSTTIEQGDVADKLRALGGAGGEAPRRGNTSITSTGMMDEPTVDDQRAQAIVAMLPPPVLSRLVITQGADAGTLIEIRPGKSYTIGRGVDNDVVLGDIAVSRKHFDLHFDNGSWVIVDRGSGNGTLVNGNVEDAPFMLAPGDVIEIGNTTFRFESPAGNAVPPPASSLSFAAETPVYAPASAEVRGQLARPSPAVSGKHGTPAPTFDVSLDDEIEPSTMSGRPPERPQSASVPPPPPLARAQTQAPRPRTLPPPAPRGPPVTQPPPPVMLGSPHSPPLPHGSLGAGSQPLPAAAPMGYGEPPRARAVSAAPIGYAQPMPLDPYAHSRASLPGPAMLGEVPSLMPTTIPGAGVPYSYPSAPDLSSYPGQHHHPSHPMLIASHGSREATSTANVAHTPWGGQAMVPGLGPMFSRRVKLVAGGAALALFAAVTTVAIINSSSAEQPADGSAAQVITAPVAKAAPKEPTIEPIDTPKPTITPVPTIAPPTVVAKPPPTVVAPPPAPVPPAPQPTVAVVHPTIAPPTVAPRPTIAPPPTAPPVNTRPNFSSVTPQHAAPLPPPPPPVHVEHHAAPPAPIVHSEPPPAHHEHKATHVAVADDGAAPASLAGTGSARKKAESLYQQKKFADAANAIRASDKSMAATYDSLARAYNVGFAPGTKAIEAYVALRKASNFDRAAGGAFSSEIDEKLGQVSAKASMAYSASKEYENAYQAVLTAERLGASNGSTNTVRQILDSRAQDLYNEAAKEMSSNKDEATTTLKTVMHMTDSKNPYYQKSAKLLAANQ